MRFLRTAILAIGLMSLAGACGGKQKPAEAPANPCAANPCGENPCAANPCGENPCGGDDMGANPCGGDE